MNQVKEQLKKLRVRPVKERGQNFLIDSSVIQAIIDFAKPDKSENLVEIGPGLGALTAELYRIAPLKVIEIEEAFCADLIKRFPDLVIFNDDVRSVDFNELGEELTVFGNLPYSFSTDIIFHLVAFAPAINRAVLLLQREFAERLAAEPGGRDYGALTVSAKLWTNVRLGPTVSGGAFHPPAKVDSTVVELRFLSEPRYQVKNSFWYQRVVKAAFFKRRRKLLNSLNASQAFPDLDIEAILEELDISKEQRAETLSIAEYVKLSNRVSEELG